MSRAQLTSTDQQNSGGAVAPFVSGKNKIINGDFGISQRGVTFSNPTVNQYTLDRWFFGGGGNMTGTISQQTFTPGNAIAGYESASFLRYAITGSTTTPNITTKLEDVRLFAGQTVTVSFWAKATSSITPNYIDLYQNFGSGGSSGVDTTANPTIIGTATTAIGTSWARYSATITLPSISGKTIGTGSALWVNLQFPTITSNTIDIWGVQLEAGSVATPFTTASNTLQGELALCQRYLPALIGPNQSIVSLATGTTNTFVTIKMPVTARVAPTGITIPSLSLFNVFNGSLSTANPTAISFDSSGTDYVTIAVTTSAGSPTIAAGQADLFRLNSTGAYILFTGCEL